MDIDGAEAPQGVELMDFEDFRKHRQLIFDKAKDAMEKQFPREYNGVRMELEDLHYVDRDDYTLAEQKKALHEDKFLRRRLVGRVKLKDANTGALLDEKSMTLMGVPWLTDRGTFIREGNEWGSIAQQRLLPGAYSRVQNNGDLETQFNVRPGTGGAFKVNFNPESAQFRFSIGGANLHFYSLLHDLGVDDDVLKASWGDDVLSTNQANYDSRTLDKAYNKVVPEWMRKGLKNVTQQEKADLIKKALNRAQMSSYVAKQTLPNLFSREKSAMWRAQGALIQKIAAASKDTLQDIATYINAAEGKDIDINAEKEKLTEEIKNTVVTGLKDASPESGKVDNSDMAARVVRQLRAARVIETIKKKLNYGY